MYAVSNVIITWIILAVTLFAWRCRSFVNKLSSWSSVYTDKLRILRANVVLNLTFYRRRSCSRSGRRNMYRIGRLALAARACWLCVSGVTRNSGAPGQISKSRLSSPPSPYLTFPSFWPIVGPGRPFSPLSIYFLIFPPLLFSFFHWLYLFSSFVHPFPFYQNSPTPFPGRRS